MQSVKSFWRKKKYCGKKWRISGKQENSWIYVYKKLFLSLDVGKHFRSLETCSKIDVKFYTGIFILKSLLDQKVVFGVANRYILFGSLEEILEEND